LAPSQIGDRPEEFVSCIYEIFGIGGKSIEDMIVEEICREFAIDPSSVSGLIDVLSFASKNMREHSIQELQIAE
jgi:hypothetical protein